MMVLTAPVSEISPFRTRPLATPSSTMSVKRTAIGTPILSPSALHGTYHLNKKKKSNESGYPDEAIKTLARCFYPSMVEFFNSEEGQREYEEWLKEQRTLQALPVAA